MTEPTRLPPEALLFLCRRDFPQAGVGIAGRGSVALVRIVDGSGGGRGAQRQIIGVEVDWSAAKFDPEIAESEIQREVSCCSTRPDGAAEFTLWSRRVGTQ
jgi:hypothetical protein